MGRCQVHDGTGAGADGPRSQFNGPISEGVGTLGKGKAGVLIGVQGNAKGLEDYLSHKIGAASRAPAADRLALYLLDVRYRALF